MHRFKTRQNLRNISEQNVHRFFSNLPKNVARYIYRCQCQNTNILASTSGTNFIMRRNNTLLFYVMSVLLALLSFEGYTKDDIESDKVALIVRVK